MKTYKGFDKDFKCRDFQYEIGKEYEMDGNIERCERGFHSCEDPFDVWWYYPPGESKFAECEIGGKIDKESDGDTKVASSKITIKAELNLFEFVKLGVEKILSKVDFKNAKESNTGEYSAATNTGYRSAATNTGSSSAATNTGYSSAASVTGKESIACGLGYDNMAAGELGCWIVLAERDVDDKIKSVKTAKVDGKKILPNVFYKLKNGKFVKA